MIIASELRAGMVIRRDGQIFKVLEVHVKPGAAKTAGVVKTTLENLRGGHLWDHNFRLIERVEDIRLDQQRMEFLFSDGEIHTFMNSETFEQLDIPKSELPDSTVLLQPGMEVTIEFFEGKPVHITIPEIFEARVVETAPAIHGQQVSTWKQAVLENGLRVMVPLFIENDEMIRVNLKAGRYIERVHAAHAKLA